MARMIIDPKPWPKEMHQNAWVLRACPTVMPESTSAAAVAGCPAAARASVGASPSGRRPRSSGRLNMNRGRIRAQTNTMAATSRAVLRHPNRPTGSAKSHGADGSHDSRPISGSVVQAMAGTMVIAPRPIPTITSPIASPRWRTNQWFISVIRGTQPPNPCPIESSTKASRNHQKFWVKAKKTKAPDSASSPTITIRRAPKRSAR